MGRSIMLREFRAPQMNAPLVLVIGGIHGDELTSVSIVFRWIELLQQPGYDGPPYPLARDSVLESGRSAGEAADARQRARRGPQPEFPHP